MNAQPTQPTQPQPFNSMIPVSLETPFGEQHGMTMAEAEAVFAKPYDLIDWLAVLNVGSAAYILGHDVMALELTQHAITLNPQVAASWINLAVIQGARGDFYRAGVAAENAYHVEPENRTAATIYAESLLRLGRWREAWPLFHNYYDAKRVSLFRYAIREWTGQSLRGKRILVIEGGGFGDNFFFLRWLPMLKARGAHITYLCPASMLTLMEQQPYIDRLIPTQAGETESIIPGEFDYFIPLLALGYRFDATTRNVKCVSYIKSSARERRDHIDPSLIGFCWKAAESCLPRPFRSLAASHITQVCNTILDHNHQIVNLVLGENPDIHDWRDTARIIRTCDLIVTVDTGVAHLAGALGVPTWVILPGFSAWYYLTGTFTAPFYPSMRLFRNGVRGLDISVLACCKALEAIA